MGEYTTFDLSESVLRAELDVRNLVKVIRAWGQAGQCAEWSGGFVFLLADGRYAYLSGWCDTTGWGCQDGAELVYADTLEGLCLPDDVDWDVEPADLNLWIARGCLGSYDD